MQEREQQERERQERERLERERERQERERQERERQLADRRHAALARQPPPQPLPLPQSQLQGLGVGLPAARPRLSPSALSPPIASPPTRDGGTSPFDPYSSQLRISPAHMPGLDAPLSAGGGSRFGRFGGLGEMGDADSRIEDMTQMLAEDMIGDLWDAPDEGSAQLDPLPDPCPEL